MNYWVIIQNEGSEPEIFYGEENQAQEKSPARLYGPFQYRRLAKSCFLNLLNDDPAILAIAEQSRVQTAKAQKQAAPVAAPVSEPATGPADPEKKKPGRPKKG